MAIYDGEKENMVDPFDRYSPLFWGAYHTKQRQCNCPFNLYPLLMEKVSRSKALETCLVLSTAFLLLYFLRSNEVFLYIAFAFGIIGVLIKPLALIIGMVWFKIGEILGFVVSKLVLGGIFFLFLFPLSLLYRLTKKDPLKIRRAEESTWLEKNHTFEGKDLENIW